MTFVTTTYAGPGRPGTFEAVQIPWPEVEAFLGRPFGPDGILADEAILVAALLDAGAPGWVRDAEGWTDEAGWGLVGPEIVEDEVRS